jgi:hypothetical protein
MRVKEQSDFVNLSNTLLNLLIRFTKHNRQHNLRRMDMVHMNRVAVSHGARC